MAPAAAKIAALINPKTVVADAETVILKEAASAAGVDLYIAGASTRKDLTQAFEDSVKSGARALIVSADPFFMIERAQIVSLAARDKLPASYPWRAYAERNGLMSYGPDINNAYRQIGVYAALVLEGASPSELPIVKPTTVELVINLKTANRLGLRV